jgi:sigma-B regulation protein RsbU (phosphoserine phosphatase)
MTHVAQDAETGIKGGTAPLAPLKVLLIEDNPLDARLIQIMVAEAGAGMFQVDRVDRVSSGVQRLAHGDIELVLLDLSLPDSHGLTTFENVHTAFPKIPIIVMSGLDDQGVAVHAVHQGAQDFLVKGQVNGALLVRAMRYALERMRTAEQLERYASALRERNAQMEADLAMAREIQQVFLPENYPSFPKSALPGQSALCFFHRYLPAAAVSGDFFNVFPLSDNRAGVFICDVMGHGMRAALVTAIMRGLVEELLPVANDAGRFLSDINQSLHAILRRTDVPMLATAFYFIVDTNASHAEFSSAGHPSPIRVQRQNGGVAEFLKNYDAKHGPALGLFESAEYPVGRVPISADDLFIFYTDGLYEANGPHQQEYGQERLLAEVRNRVHLRPDQLFDQILGDVKEFSSGKEFDDDVCLVGVEVEWLGSMPPQTS